ncbi:unnamed protein product, partial [Phaeothamnion confervicola]
MREDQVESGVKFLRHPQVVTTPLSQRVAFLEKKGLTPDEISESLARAGGALGGEGTAARREHFDVENAASAGAGAVEETSFWRRALVPGLLVVGGLGAVGAAANASIGEQPPRLSPPPSSPSPSARSTAQQQPPQQTPQQAVRGGFDGLVGDTPPFTGEASSAAATAATFASDTDGRAVKTPRLTSNAATAPADASSTAAGTIGAAGICAVAAPAGASADASATLRLAAEFGRLTDAMELQGAQLCEAISAMKTLAERTARDAAAAAAAAAHDMQASDLRAELGTIKQLLLMHATGGGAQGGGCGGGSGGAGAGGGGASGGEARSHTAGHSSPISAGKGDENGSATTASSAAAGGEGGPPEDAATVALAAAAAEAEAAAMAAAADAEAAAAKAAADAEVAAAKAAVCEAAAARLTSARDAVSALRRDNPAETVKAAVPMLQVILANLVSKPTVPRYRRLSTVNQNYKQLVEPVAGHKTLLEAVGFKEKGTAFEWGWHSAGCSTTEAHLTKAVLQDVLSGLSAAAGGPPGASSLAGGASAAAAADPKPATAAAAAAAATAAAAAAAAAPTAVPVPA